MAIVIINEKPAPHVVKQVVCYNCGVTLEYTPNDTRKVVYYDYGGGADACKVIDCPKCQKELQVK